MAYFGGIFFANMGGGGGQNYFQARNQIVVKSCVPFFQNHYTYGEALFGMI